MVPPGHYAATARAAARSILQAPPFVTPHRPPGVFTRVADDVGHGIVAAVRWILHQLGRFLAHPVGHAAHAVFGGWSTPVLIAAGVLLVAVLSVLVVHRSRPVRGEPADDPGASHRRRSEALLARAAAARDAGDLDAALRLRFEAGLEQLEAKGLVRERTTLTTSAIAAQVRSATFDELASVHTLVAYAGVPASDRDVDVAFERWPEVARGRRVPASAR